MNSVINIAHRGARSIAPENTILSASKAIENNADMWELDVQLTSDFKLIVIHDNTLERTSNISKINKYKSRKPWLVYDFTLKEIKDLDAGKWYFDNDPFEQIKKGNIENNIKLFENITAPTLKEALLFTKNNNFKINIEIKDVTKAFPQYSITQKVIELVNEYELVKDVIISSFNDKYLYEAKKIDKSIKIALLSDDAGDDHLSKIKELNAFAFHPHYKMCDKKMISNMKKNSILINVWNINDKQEMIKFIDMGVNGIFTDFPQILKDLI